MWVAFLDWGQRHCRRYSLIDDDDPSSFSILQEKSILHLRPNPGVFVWDFNLVQRRGIANTPNKMYQAIGSIFTNKWKHYYCFLVYINWKCPLNQSSVLFKIKKISRAISTAQSYSFSKLWNLSTAYPKTRIYWKSIAAHQTLLNDNSSYFPFMRLDSNQLWPLVMLLWWRIDYPLHHSGTKHVLTNPNLRAYLNHPLTTPNEGKL